MSEPRRYPRVSTCASSSGGGGGPVEVTGTVSIEGPVDVTGTVSIEAPIDIGTPVALDLTNGTGDAFGRLRVSNPFTLFEFNSILGKGSDISEGQVVLNESLTNGATATHYPRDAYVEMVVGPTNNSVAIRQSHEYILYQPGKSKLVYMTGILRTADSSTTGITSRIGVFDASMGFFVQYENGTYSVVERCQDGTSTTVNRSSWLDPLNGTGPSGVSIDFTKAQIFTFDFEWLGVGQVRCGIVAAGILHYFHVFTHTGTAALEKPYITTAKLPLRYEIRSTAAGAIGKMRMICGTVISEGGFSPASQIRSYPQRRTTIGGNQRLGYWDLVAASGSDDGAFFPLISIQIRTTYPHRYGTIKIKKVDIFCSDSSRVGSWQLLLNPTFSAPLPSFTQYDPSGSIAEVYSHPSTPSTSPLSYNQTSGAVLYQDYWTSRTNSILFSSVEDLAAAPAIAVGLDGQTDRVTLVANVLNQSGGGGNVTVYAFISWIEIL